MNGELNVMQSSVMLDGTIQSDVLTSATTDTSFSELQFGDYYNLRYCWDWWYQYYMPIYQPVYYSTLSPDKGKQAIAIMRALMDKGIVKINKVEDFVKAIDVVLNVI